MTTSHTESQATDTTATSLPGELATSLLRQYGRVRAATEALTAPLAPEDCVVQSMPEASPAKWHLAHTSWFFETFLLARRLREYQPFHLAYGYLFNSYYEAVGPRLARPSRGMITRPGLDEIYAYRRHVDARMEDLLRATDDPALVKLAPLLQLGLHHEQQHQELVLTDVKHALSLNPLKPAYHAPPGEVERRPVPPLTWSAFDEDVRWIGYHGIGFSFDNERPRHRVFLDAFELASRLVTNDEYLSFIEDGGYQRPELWLSEGWDHVQRAGWRAPLYWDRGPGEWQHFTLSGMRPLDPREPVCHLSYFEADAFARWANARLPTEAEWEVAATHAGVEGNFVESQRLHPAPLGRSKEPIAQLFGDVWEWTASSYAPYPGFKPEPGAVGEYNGKFMVNQMVLRGGSCASPRTHLRATYRNFWAPHTRWQLTGIRLARDARGGR